MAVLCRSAAAAAAAAATPGNGSQRSCSVGLTPSVHVSSSRTLGVAVDGRGERQRHSNLQQRLTSAKARELAAQQLPSVKLVLTDIDFQVDQFVPGHEHASRIAIVFQELGVWSRGLAASSPPLPGVMAPHQYTHAAAAAAASTSNHTSLAHAAGFASAASTADMNKAGSARFDPPVPSTATASALPHADASPLKHQQQINNQQHQQRFQQQQQQQHQHQHQQQRQRGAANSEPWERVLLRHGKTGEERSMKAVRLLLDGVRPDPQIAWEELRYVDEWRIEGHKGEGWRCSG